MSLPHQPVELNITIYVEMELNHQPNLEIETAVDWRCEDPGVDVHPGARVGVDLGVADWTAPALEDLEVPGEAGGSLAGALTSLLTTLKKTAVLDITGMSRLALPGRRSDNKYSRLEICSSSWVTLL